MSDIELPSEREEAKEEELASGETWEDRGRLIIEKSGLDSMTITNLLQIYNGLHIIDLEEVHGSLGPLPSCEICKFQFRRGNFEQVIKL